MTDLTTRNILLYVGSMLIGAVAAALAALLVQLSGADPVNWTSRTPRPSISCLLYLRSPSAILRTVGAVVVDAVDAVRRRWPGAHVGVKRLKARPPLTDRDPAPAVIAVDVALRTQASAAHVLPDPVLRSAMRQSVSAMGIARRLEHEAAARDRVTAPEAVSNDRSLIPTVATADPSDLTVVGSLDVFSEYRQAPEAVTGSLLDSIRGGLLPQTAARLGVAGAEAFGLAQRRLAAIASALPSSATIWEIVRRFADDGQEPEPLAGFKRDTLLGHREPPTLGVTPPAVDAARGPHDARIIPATRRAA
jgi:hypothetical protein